MGCISASPTDIAYYTYDAGGNITSRDEYAYTTAETVSGACTSHKTYGYTDPTWKDLLTSYDGQTITTDGMGNPLNYRDGIKLTWKNGRQLTSSTVGNIVTTYNYDMSGNRVYRAGGGFRHTYYVVDGTTLGEKIVFVSNGATKYMEYMRDENGEVYGFIYDGGTYFLEKNALGDVKYLLNSSGSVLAKYTYDEWGKVVSVTDANGNAITDKANIAHLNPFRYRSYYYDWETGFYYLNSRYYDPSLCRFLNADAYVSTGQGMNGYNMFAYCSNNPIVNADPNGHFVIAATTIGIGVSIALKLLVTVVAAIVIVEATKAIINNTSVAIDNARVRREFRQRDNTKEDEKEKDVVTPDTSQPETKIYRYGGTNPGNLTPKEKDLKDGRGLSFRTNPKPGCAETTIEAINATGIVYAVQDGPDHVSVYPVGGTMSDWVSEGSSSIWTQAVKSVVKKWDGGN